MSDTEEAKVKAKGNGIEGMDIAKVLTSSGPVVKCVVLRACKHENGNKVSTTSDEKLNGDSNPATTEKEQEPQQPQQQSQEEGEGEVKRQVLTDLIDQIEIDTTPSKSMVSKELGGPFTFLGQYEDEGIILMVRNLPDDVLDVIDSIEDGCEDDENTNSIGISDVLKEKKLSELKALCQQLEIDTKGMLEKSDLIQAITSRIPPINPHSLQPPLHRAIVRGDIIAMRVAETKEELDNDDDDDDNNENEEAAEKMTVPSNEEFFLDYTKEEYIQFASRTDIEEHEVELSDPEQMEEEEEDDEEDQEDGDAVAVDGEEANQDDDDGVLIVGGDETIEEEDKSAMFNLVMNEVLRQYREENGRGPNTQELLELRATIAKELDVEVAQVEDADWDKKAKETASTGKKIGFHEEDKVLEYQPHENEHNHHYLPADDDEHDYDEDDDDEGDPSYEPPRKRLRTDGGAVDGSNEDNDAKPAAIQEEDAKPAATKANGSEQELASPSSEQAEEKTTEPASGTTNDGQ